MLIIIDGYNLLKTIKGSNATEQQRSELIGFLGDYQKRQGHEVIIIFDGGPSCRPIIERQSGVTIILAGTRFSADHCIIEYVQGRNQQDMVVVTADRELIREVKTYQVSAVDPHTFYHRVHKRVTEQNKLEAFKYDLSDLIKYDQSDSPEDEVMYEAAQMGCFDKYEQVSLHRLRKGNKIAKKKKADLVIKNKL